MKSLDLKKPVRPHGRGNPAAWARVLWVHRASFLHGGGRAPIQEA